MKTHFTHIRIFRTLLVLVCLGTCFYLSGGEQPGKLCVMPISSGIHLDRTGLLISGGNYGSAAKIPAPEQSPASGIRLVEHVESGTAAPNRMNALPPINVNSGGTEIEEFVLPDLPADTDEEKAAEPDDIFFDVPLAAPENAPSAELPDFVPPAVTPDFEFLVDGEPENRPLAMPEGLNQPLEGEAAATAADISAEYRNVPVETASFNGVIPGKSTIQEAAKILGQPVNTVKSGGGDGVDAYEFKVEEFRSVTAHVMENVVFAISADLPQSVHARTLARNLGLESIQSVFLSDDKGNIMGEIFPEIGVSFGYDLNSKIPNVNDVHEKGMDTADMQTNVIQILFQPVSPEPFMFRAESWRTEDPQRSLWDVEQALKLDPQHPEAVAMRAALLSEMAAKGITPGTQVAQTPPSNMPEVPSFIQNATPPSRVPDIFTEAAKPDPVAAAEPADTPAAEEMVPPLEPILREPLPYADIPDDEDDEDESQFAEAEAPPVDPAEVLLEAESLAHAGYHFEALQKNEEIRNQYPAQAVLQACSFALEGDIRMIMDDADFEAAMKAYTRAIRLGTSLLTTGKTLDGKGYVPKEHEQILLQKMLVDAHLGVAANVAQGKWGNKEEAVSQWLENALRKAEQFIARKYTPEGYEALLIRYRVSVRSVAITTLTGKTMDPRKETGNLMNASAELLKHVPDKKTYQLVCYETALALDDAAQVCIQRGEYAHALKFLQRGTAMMEKVLESRKTLEINDVFLLGNLYYRTGFIYSLHAQYAAESRTKNMLKGEIDYHKSAVYYYEKALPHMMQAVSQRHFRDQLALGEMTAGMSVSYWEVGNHSRTEDLLKAGVLCLEHHVLNHPEDQPRLAVPYENLSQVLRYLEKPQEAAGYERKLASIKRG